MKLNKFIKDLSEVLEKYPDATLEDGLYVVDIKKDRFVEVFSIKSNGMHRHAFKIYHEGACEV